MLPYNFFNVINPIWPPCQGIDHVDKLTFYLLFQGRKFIADLLPNGKIMTPATKEMFGTPSAWAAHCKRQVNPHKKSGCGWNSVSHQIKEWAIIVFVPSNYFVIS